MSTAIEQSLGGSSDWIHTRAAAIVADRLGRAPELLDVGCGAGVFLERLAGLGVQRLSGCDGGEFHERVRRFNFTRADLNQALPYPDSRFDLVTSLEVVEHLENPRHFARELHRILRPGGALLLSTPNNECATSLLSLALRGYFSAFADSCYPAHITPVLAIDGRRILAEAGFRGVRTLWSERGRMPGLPLHWQSLFGPLARGRLFSDNYYLLAEK